MGTKLPTPLDIVGGAYYITQLTNRVASAANAEFHARIIAQKFIQRELIRVSTKTINDAYEEGSDVFDLLDNVESSLFSIMEGNIKKNYDKMSTLINKAIEQIEITRKNKGSFSGVSSGLTALDRLTNGWQKSDLVIIAARPAMGKTALVLTMARNAAVDFNKPVAIFSLPRIQSIHQTSGFGIPSTFLLTSIQTDRSEPQFLHVPS